LPCRNCILQPIVIFTHTHAHTFRPYISHLCHRRCTTSTIQLWYFEMQFEHFLFSLSAVLLFSDAFGFRETSSWLSSIRIHQHDPASRYIYNKTIKKAESIRALDYVDEMFVFKLGHSLTTSIEWKKNKIKLWTCTHSVSSTLRLAVAQPKWIFQSEFFLFIRRKHEKLVNFF
jgi:hypothetical protein